MFSPIEEMKIGTGSKMRKITFFIALAILGLFPLTVGAAEYASREEAVALVQRTIAAIKRDGIEAIVAAVNDKDTRFKDRDLYVFIGDLKVPGQLVAHGTNVKLTEGNTINLRDENGKYFVRELWEVARKNGSGWVDYRWANPDKTQFADKTSYVERVGDHFVAVGVYVTHGAPNENTVGIISGNPYSAPTFLQFAYDMAVELNDGYNLRVVPVIGMGGVQNIRDVQSLKGIDIGFTQSNVLNSYRKANKEQVGVNEDKIVYIANLFNEEVHLIARKDVGSISALRGQKVNIDVAGSGTAFTMRDIFKNLGIQIEEVNVDQADALEQMKSGEIAATVLVAGKPVSVIQTIPREYGFHILPVPYADAIQADYLPAQFTPEDYPALLREGASVDTVAVSAVLIAYNWRSNTDRYRRVKKFVEALFKKIDRFQKASRHPKWQSVNLASTLPGWDRFDVAETLLADTTTTGSLSTTQSSFDKFMETRGVLAKTTPEQREKLFSEFMEWAATHQ